METFLIIFCVILISIILIMMNIAIYKTIIDSVDNIPKWLNRVLLIPPFSFVGILIILIVFSLSEISNGFKKYW
jgi:hypothetical protein